MLQVEELATARALEVGTVQQSLGTAFGIMCIHPTYLAGVRGWVESGVLWCNVYNIQVGAWIAKMVALQLVRLVNARFATRGPTN